LKTKTRILQLRSVSFGNQLLILWRKTGKV